VPCGRCLPRQQAEFVLSLTVLIFSLRDAAAVLGGGLPSDRYDRFHWPFGKRAGSRDVWVVDRWLSVESAARCTTLPAQKFGGTRVQKIEGLGRIERLGHGAHASLLILVRLPIGLGHAPHQGIE
jgi:hypothetical protein